MRLWWVCEEHGVGVRIVGRGGVCGEGVRGAWEVK